MEWSWTLGNIRGIKIKVHLTFALLVLWEAYSGAGPSHRDWNGALFGVAIIILLFVCVVLHELAHSLVAMHYGVRVREIELLPIGGVSKMESMPERPYQEFVMALAGPLVNLGIAVPLGLLVLLFIVQGQIHSLNLSYLFYLMSKPSWTGLVLNLFASNVMLAAFNLLPALPMDGGRVLRSVLAWMFGPRTATRVAAQVAQAFAIGLGLLAVFSGQWLLVVIALFVFGGAQQERRMSDVQSVLSGIHVGQAVITACETLTPDQTVDAVLQHTLHGHPACYGVLDAGRLVGMLTHDDITAALEAYGRSVRVGDVMRTSFSSVSTTDSLAQAWQTMARTGLRSLPVVEEGVLRGILTAQQIGQIYSFLVAQQRRPPGR